MICATAKSTDVSRRQRPWPSLARMDRPAGRSEAVETAAGVAMTGS